MDMIWVLMIFFIFVTVVFIAVALLFPEWVGITGNKALEIQKHQSGEDTSKTSSEDTSRADSQKPT